MSKEYIESGRACLGIEFGSTRIKATLIGEDFSVLASGSHEWQNSYSEGYWTYSLEEIKEGLRSCYSSLCQSVLENYGIFPTSYASMGISAMMHGYLAFDKNDRLLCPFRTWRNTTTARAADILSEKLGFNIPQRWSSAHLYEALLSREEHTDKIASVNTLAGYIHFLLTGERVLGIGDASGIFPVKDGDYDSEKLKIYDECLKAAGARFCARDVFPRVLSAGKMAGRLTEEGARLLDESGRLLPGIPMCPPEGDAGTGMVATNSVRPGTGNVSAGTSIFSMIVLSENMKSYYREIDVVATPDGYPCAMVHCNNCSTEIDAWVNMFGEFAVLTGSTATKSEIYEWLFRSTTTADPDCGGIASFNYVSGEHVTGVEKGRPMYFRRHDSVMNLSNFFKSLLYSCFATLRLGTDILRSGEDVKLSGIFAHGGLFKTRGVAQQILADALGTTVSVCETSGEGGSWGIAILAKYMSDNSGLSLGDYLEGRVFANMKTEALSPSREGMAGFNKFIERYKGGLVAEKALSEVE